MSHIGCREHFGLKLGPIRSTPMGIEPYGSSVATLCNHQAGHVSGDKMAVATTPESADGALHQRP